MQITFVAGYLSKEEEFLLKFREVETVLTLPLGRVSKRKILNVFLVEKWYRSFFSKYSLNAFSTIEKGIKKETFTSSTIASPVKVASTLYIFSSPIFDHSKKLITVTKS